MKRIMCLVLCLFFVLTACNSGSKGKNSASTDAPVVAGATDAPDATAKPNKPKEVVELTAWSTGAAPQGMLSSTMSKTKVGAVVANAAGVSYTINYTEGSPDTAFNLRLASGDWEDIITTSKNFEWTSKLIKSNAIIPLDKYFEDAKHYPNLAAIPKDVLNAYKFEDGHIYQFPSGWYENPDSIFGYWAAMGWYVLPEHLAAVHMTEADLTTIEGIEKFLKAVKDAKLKNKDGLDIIPMSSGADIHLWTTIATTFGVSVADMGFAKQGDGTYLHYRDDPRMVKAFQWLNKMYREGLLDKELLSQKNEQLQQKLSTSRVALMADEAWPFWGTVTGGKSPVTELKVLHFPKVPGVDKLGIATTYNPLGTGGTFVTKKNKNPDAVARYADWNSAQGVSRGWESAYGPRGTYWDWDPVKGKPYFVLTDPDFKQASDAGDYKKLAELGASLSMAPFDLDLNYYRAENEKGLFWIFNMHKFNAVEGYVSKAQPWHTLLMPTDGVYNTNIQTLKGLDLEYYAKLIIAKSDAEFTKTWDEYRSKLESTGKWSAVKKEWNDTMAALK